VKRARIALDISARIGDDILYCSCRCPWLQSWPGMSQPWVCGVFLIALPVAPKEQECPCYRCFQCLADGEVTDAE